MSFSAMRMCLRRMMVMMSGMVRMMIRRLRDQPRWPQPEPLGRESNGADGGVVVVGACCCCTMNGVSTVSSFSSPNLERFLTKMSNRTERRVATY